MPIKTQSGSATSARPDKHGVIVAHICNNVGAWGKGFVLAVDELSAAPRAAYMGLARDHGKTTTQSSANIPLGHWQFVETQPGLFVANMIAQKGIKRSGNECLVDYDALRKCLRATFHRAARLGYSVHMPAGMGSGLAGGDKATIHQIVKEIADEVEQSPFAKQIGAIIDITLWEFADSNARSFVPATGTSTNPPSSMKSDADVEDTSDSGTVISTDDLSELG